MGESNQAGAGTVSHDGVRALAVNFAVLWCAFLASKVCYALIVSLLSRSWHGPVVSQTVLVLACSIAVSITSGFVAFRMEWLSGPGLRSAADKAEYAPSSMFSVAEDLTSADTLAARDKRVMAFCFLQQNRAVVLLAFSEAVALLGLVAALNCQEPRLYAPFFVVSVVLMLLTPLRLQNLIDRGFAPAAPASAAKPA